MAVRTSILVILLALALAVFAAPPPEEKVEFVCPMDKDVRSPNPGKCPRCGMKLVAGLPDPLEYPLELSLTPRLAKPGEEVTLRFRINDPKTGKPVTKFEEVHEKLFHLFLVSADLQFFAHQHPELQSDGTFVFRTRLPMGGEYRVLSDFFPAGGAPQLIAKSIFVKGTGSLVGIDPDLEAKTAENLQVALRMEPAKPIAGMKTLMFFDIKPSEGLEPYLGAWGHMLAASSDLIDMIHSHPAFNEGGPTVQFNLIFPRPGVYRVWVQFQREGKVNTVAFNVPVSELK